MSNLEKRAAQELLIGCGINVIWQAQVSASTAYRAGNDKATEILLRFANAEETIWCSDVSHPVRSRSRCAPIALGRTLACNPPGQSPSLKWIVDDCGHVAALENHPVALWASGFDPPEKAILELGFIFIEDRSDGLILALHISKVEPVTLAGAFYFLAKYRRNRIVIYSHYTTGRAQITIVGNVIKAYLLLEKLLAFPLAETVPISQTPVSCSEAEATAPILA
jgi:hypothetical protein